MRALKMLTLFCCLLSILPANAQKAALFKDINFDSSYQVIGMAWMYQKPGDVLERFWFLLEDPGEMTQLQRDWVFRNKVSRLRLELVGVDIYVIKNKQPIANYGLIYPEQGLINIEGNWYPFDTSRLVKLHAAHPLKFRTELKSFDTYAQYAAYGNSLLTDSTLLFFQAPSLRFEGKFTIMVKRTADPASPYFILRDVNKELLALAPAGSFEVGKPENDSFNLARRDSVKIVVECSKSLYDKYEHKWRVKGPWEPTKIEITTYWRKEP